MHVEQRPGTPHDRTPRESRGAFQVAPLPYGLGAQQATLVQNDKPHLDLPKNFDW